MVLIYGDLARDDITVALEHVNKTFGVDNFGDISDVEILVSETGHVGTEEVVLLGKTSARLAFKIEVSELLGNLVELFGVVDLDDSGVKGFVLFTTDYGHMIQVVASEVLDHLSEGSGSITVCGKIVQVDGVGIMRFFDSLLHFCFKKS